MILLLVFMSPFFVIVNWKWFLILYTVSKYTHTHTHTTHILHTYYTVVTVHTHSTHTHYTLHTYTHYICYSSWQHCAGRTVKSYECEWSIKCSLRQTRPLSARRWCRCIMSPWLLVGNIMNEFWQPRDCPGSVSNLTSCFHSTSPNGDNHVAMAISSFWYNWRYSAVLTSRRDNDDEITYPPLCANLI